MKYKIGDIVKVKQGVKDFNFKDVSISGWQGEIFEINGELVQVEWDNTTLNEMSDEYLEQVERKGYELEVYGLGIDEIEPAEPRPEVELIERYINALDEEKRIAAILGDDDLDFTDEKLEKYRQYLEANLNPNLLLTGSEDFPWEERFFFGNGDKHEYKEMRKTRPSSKDLFRFMAIEEEIEDQLKLIVKVKRLTDRKFFSIPLCDLLPNDKNFPDYQILEDYSIWITNWGEG